MKPKPKFTVTPQLVQEAAAKLAQARRAADADGRLAKAAKGQLKSVKKTWKLARKAAKRSGKRVEEAEKILAELQKKLKRSQSKSTRAAKPPRKAKVRRRAPAKAAVAAPELASPSSVIPATAPDAGASSGEA
jgi:chromosome segregation ATPase